MRKKVPVTQIVFILDRSGSMHHLEEDTIGSFNNLIKKQKKEEGYAYVTTVLFDNHIELLHHNQSIKTINPITNNEYYARGTTALLDAIGITLRKTRHEYNDLFKEERPDNVMFVIITDGMENASKEFTRSKVKKHIERAKERYNWEFLFIGANIDAVKEGSFMGISADRSVDFYADKKGSETVYRTINKTITSYRQNSKLDEDWNEEIMADYQSR